MREYKMNKLILILMLVFLTFSTMADIHVSKNGKILDPGMYWAINARYELEDFNKGKGNKSQLMNHLLLSASYGFNPSRFGIGMIYAMGSNGFEKDLPRAYAWLNMAAKGKDQSIVAQRDMVKNNLSQKDIVKANKISLKINKRYGNDAAFKKFQKWIDEANTVTGSRIKGNHTYLNVQHRLAGGKNLSTFDLYNRLNKIYDKQLDNQGYKVIQQEIKTD
jgi:TPR repeat protein